MRPFSALINVVIDPQEKRELFRQHGRLGCRYGNRTLRP